MEVLFIRIDRMAFDFQDGVTKGPNDGRSGIQ